MQLLHHDRGPLNDSQPPVEGDCPRPRVNFAIPVCNAELLFDPIYRLIRRGTLERSGMLPVNRWTDRLLAF